MLSRIEDMMDRAETYKEIIPDDLQTAYFELVYFPTVASANVTRMQIYSGLNKYFAEQYSALVRMNRHHGNQKKGTVKKRLSLIEDAGTNPKVFTEFTLKRKVMAEKIKVEIYTSHWIRINELEAIETQKFTPNK